jgi:hypothetical protein
LKNYTFLRPVALLLTCVCVVQGTFSLAQEVALSPSDLGELPVSIAPRLAPRKLATGVLITVPPDQNAGDMTIGPQDMDFVSTHPELEWGPPTFPEGKPNTFAKSDTLLEMGRAVTLRHPIYALEFSFKPMRLIEGRVAGPTGMMEDALVWYMVYRVRYMGGDLLPNEEKIEAGTGVPNEPKRAVFDSVRFLPRFTLIAPELNQQYDSQVISTVTGAIENRERVGKPLLDYMQISEQPIKATSEDADNSVWGVATWAGVDPRIDAFYVDIRGLTNAFQREINSENAEVYRRKTLRLYFWKPGDTVDQTADRIQLGIPSFESPTRQLEILKLFKVNEPLDHSWIYR